MTPFGRGLSLQVGDIDAQRMRIHVHAGKGNKDRYVPMPAALLRTLRQWWRTHRHPRLLFPNPRGGLDHMRQAKIPMPASGTQAGMRAAVAECGTQLRITPHSLRHLYSTHMLELGVDLREVYDPLIKMVWQTELVVHQRRNLGDPRLVFRGP